MLAICFYTKKKKKKEKKPRLRGKEDGNKFDIQQQASSIEKV